MGAWGDEEGSGVGTHRKDHAAEAKAAEEGEAAASPGAREDSHEGHIHALPEVDDGLPGEATAEGRGGEPEAIAHDGLHAAAADHSVLDGVEGGVAAEHADEVTATGDGEELELVRLVAHAVSDGARVCGGERGWGQTGNERGGREASGEESIVRTRAVGEGRGPRTLPAEARREQLGHGDLSGDVEAATKVGE